MNSSQLQLYWYEWRECAGALRKLGKRCDDDMRKTIQRSALAERTKSSKDLTNAELTAVLAKFRSFSRPGDFDAQMHAQEEPDQRMAQWKAKIERLGAECGIKGGLSGVEGYFWKWLKNKKVCQLDESTLRKLAFILERRKAQQAEEAGTATTPPAAAATRAPVAKPAPAASVLPEEDGEPF